MIAIRARPGSYAYGVPQEPAATPQPKAEVGTTAVRSDATPSKSKKPQPDLGKQQTVASAGDTVPVVFCKRVGGIGGTWVQPALIKTGSNDFVGSFLYVISQGQMVSSPAKSSTWTGSRSILLLPDAASFTLTHYYSTAAALAANTNACPITSGNVFCGVDTYSYLSPLLSDSASVDYPPDGRYQYFKTSQITRGTGDTSNSVLKVLWSNITIFNTETGADVTAAVTSYLGIASPTTTGFIYSAIYSGSVIIGGQTVGTILNFPSSGYYAPDPNYWTSLWGVEGPLAFSWTQGTIDNQINPANPPSTGTLEGVQYEDHVSPYSDPTSPPSSADFTVFADITYLEIEGNIYDPPSEGSYPTTTKQISTFYENGISVDLYSGGLVSGVYATGASNQFVDLAMYLFTQIKRADGATTADICWYIMFGLSSTNVQCWDVVAAIR